MTAAVQEAIVARLAADAGVSALVGARVSPAPMGQGTTLPAITYLRVASKPEHVMGGGPSPESVLLQFDCWSRSYSQATQLALAVRLAVRTYRGTYSGGNGTVEIQGVQIDDQHDIPDPDPQLTHVVVDMTVFQGES